MSRPALDRLLDHIDADGDCWLWTGYRKPSGHGQFSPGLPSGTRNAHRALYEILVGPLPEGLELDHLCRNPPCVNPDHLEPVTHRENMRRAPSIAAMVRKTHCLRGHEYTPENTQRLGWTRRCRTCDRSAKARRRAAARAVPA